MACRNHVHDNTAGASHHREFHSTMDENGQHGQVPRMAPMGQRYCPKASCNVQRRRERLFGVGRPTVVREETVKVNILVDKKAENRMANLSRANRSLREICRPRTCVTREQGCVPTRGDARQGLGEEGSVKYPRRRVTRRRISVPTPF